MVYCPNVVWSCKAGWKLSKAEDRGCSVGGGGDRPGGLWGRGMARPAMLELTPYITCNSPSVEVIMRIALWKRVRM